jgi:hypothetical protein
MSSTIIAVPTDPEVESGRVAKDCEPGTAAAPARDPASAAGAARNSGGGGGKNGVDSQPAEIRTQTSTVAAIPSEIIGRRMSLAR